MESETWLLYYGRRQKSDVRRQKSEHGEQTIEQTTEDGEQGIQVVDLTSDI
jgi:hypothetical protein